MKTNDGLRCAQSSCDWHKDSAKGTVIGQAGAQACKGAETRLDSTFPSSSLLRAMAGISLRVEPREHSIPFQAELGEVTSTSCLVMGFGVS